MANDNPIQPIFKKKDKIEPVADIEEPIIKEQIPLSKTKAYRKEEEVFGELELAEDVFDANEEGPTKDDALLKEPEHKVVKYGEFKKEIKRPFGKAEQ